MDVEPANFCMKNNGINSPIENKHHEGLHFMTVAMKPEKESQRKDRTARISKEIYVNLPDDKKVGCLVIVMARSGQIWKEQESNCRQGNLPTYCVTPSPVTL